jgi:CelD/BcsL family acetyltransferase involved in cellulose biosynthesis
VSLPIDNITVVSPERLAEADWQNWSSLQQANSAYEAPSFRPEYVKLLATIRPYQRVAILVSRGRHVGYLPFVLDNKGHAFPVGQWLMSFQGLVCDSRFAVDSKMLLQATAVRQFRFDRMVLGQGGIAARPLSVVPSPIMDLARGYADYAQDLKSRGSGLVKRLEQKRRHAAKAWKLVELADEALIPDSLDLLLAWRRERNREILAADFLSVPWVPAAMTKICDARQPLFRGRLFVLRFGNHPAATLLAIQSGKVLECVVTAFNRQYAHYSPGLLLFHLLAREAHEYGIERIHLTRGTEHFKERFENRQVEVADCIIGQTAFSRAVMRGRLSAQKLVWNSPWGQPARRLWRRVLRSLDSFRSNGPTWVKMPDAQNESSPATQTLGSVGSSRKVVEAPDEHRV